MNTSKHSLKSLLLTQSKNFIVILLLLSLGSGSMIIQLLGWATMIPTKLVENGSISQAIDDTFSGKYPCEMCKLAAIKRSAEQHDSSPINPKSKKKIDKPLPLCLFPTKTICIYPPKLDQFPHLHNSPKLESLTSSPETPPPDSSLV